METPLYNALGPTSRFTQEQSDILLVSQTSEPLPTRPPSVPIPAATEGVQPLKE